MAFYNQLFPEEVSQGAKTTIRFFNTVVTSFGGRRQVQINWDAPLRQFDVSHVLYDDARRAALLSFFVAMRGNAHTFKFKDWADYLVGLAWSGGSLVVTTPEQFGTGDGSRTVWQLTKTYGTGVNPQVRSITKPRTGSGLVVYKDGVVFPPGYTVNASTGVITFNTAPANGVALQWTGQFDCHCAFEAQDAAIQLDGAHVGEWGGIMVVEQRD